MAVTIDCVHDDSDLQGLAIALHESFRTPVTSPADWRARYHIADTRVARVAGKVVGGAAIIAMGQWIGGKSVSMAGINAVGVLPEHRGQGVGSALMRSIVNELRERGFALSGLFPATQPVYRQAGYEQSGVWIRYRMPIAGIDGGSRALALERVPVPACDSLASVAASRDLGPFQDVYGRFAVGQAGLLDRTPWSWRRLFATRPPSGDDEVFAYRLGSHNDSEGYVVFTQVGHPDSHVYDLVCRDLVATSEAAWRRISGFFADHASMVQHVLFTASPSCPLHFLCREQSLVIDRTLHWMTRVIDVCAALAGRGYPAGLAGELHLRVHDDVLAGNSGDYHLVVGDGNGEATRAPIDATWQGRGDFVETDVRGLAALYTGFASPITLAQAGRMRGSERALAQASALFAGPTPWMFEIF